MCNGQKIITNALEKILMVEDLGKKWDVLVRSGL